MDSLKQAFYECMNQHLDESVHIERTPEIQKHCISLLGINNIKFHEYKTISYNGKNMNKITKIDD